MLLMASMVTVSAEECPVPNSWSPNKQYELVVSAKNADSPEDGYNVGIRRFGDDKLINFTQSGGWVYFNAATNPANIKILWSPDSKFLALYLRGGRHDGNTSIYSVNESKVQEIKFNDLDEMLRPNLGEGETFSFFVRPEFWGADRELFLSVEGSQRKPQTEAFRFVITLQLAQVKDGKVVAKVKSVRDDHSAELFAPQIEMAEVLTKDFEREDAALNAVYKKAIGSLKEDGKKKLVASQRAWIALRDAQAVFDADSDQSGCTALRNKIELTQQRIATLRMCLVDTK